MQPQLPATTDVKQTEPFALAVQSVFDAQPQCPPALQTVPYWEFAQSALVAQGRQSPLIVSHAGLPG
jgi:hypothetical protein